MYGLAKYTTNMGGQSLVERLDPRVKIAALLCAASLSLLVDSLVALSLLFAFSLVPAIIARLGWARWRVLFFLAFMITWGTMFSQAIFYYNEPRTVLVCLVDGSTPVLGPLLGNVSIYLEGFEHGAIQSLRMSSMLVLGMILCWTTDGSAMLQGLLGMRLPFVLAFMTVTALRFLPTIMQEFAMVSLAWRLRGGKLFSLNPVATLLNWLRIIRPVLINCHRRSATLALSIQTRAFSPAAAIAQSGRRRLIRSEKLWIAIFALVTLSAFTAKLLYWLYISGFYYNWYLRPLYSFCRNYL